MKAVATAWLLLLLAGCAAFAPKTTEEALGGAYVAVIALADTTTARVEAGMLEPAKAERISARLKDAKAGLDTAVVALALGDQAQGRDALAAAIAILTAIEKELQ